MHFKTIVSNKPAAAAAVLFLLIFAFSAIAGPREDIKPEEITSAINTRLITERMIKAHNIDVSTVDGIVTLTGEVNHILAEDRAVRIANSIKGVRAVVNQLHVRPMPDREDSSIKSDIKQTLLLDPATESFDIDVTVNNGGSVVLEGTVESWAEKNLVEKAAKSVKGVTLVENKVVIEYPEKRSDYELKKEIERRLLYDIWVNDYLVDVEVNNGDVKLSGAVGSLAEKQSAETDAWTYGVSSVDAEDLKIEWWADDEMKKETKYPNITDESIKEAVRDAFLYDPRVYSFNPDIEVNNGIVTLTGKVESYSAKRAAEQDARNTRGVWRVKNHLKVRPAAYYDDEILESNAEWALISDPVIDMDELEIHVINGVAHLNGRVDYRFEKAHAEEVASGQAGIVSVDNDIIVEDEWVYKPDADIEDDIEDELFWSLRVNEDDVNVDVDNGTATLTGTVASRYQAQAAVQNAFEGGARSVVDALIVENGRSHEGVYDWRYYDYLPFYPSYPPYPPYHY